MRILIVTNVYPSKARRHAGVWVKNIHGCIQEILESEEDGEIDIVYIKRSFTKFVGSVIKYLIFTIKFIPILFRRYDILHVHYFYPLTLLAYLYTLFHPQTRIVVTFHGEDITKQINGGINQWLFRQVAKRIDHTIAVGTTLKKLIQEKLLIKTDSVLAAGVDRRVFYQENNVSKSFDFLFVGSFIYRKGIDRLIGIVPEVLKKNNQLKFCFAGSGDQLRSLKALQNQYPENIEICLDQTQNELRELYNQSRFFLFPSRNEGFPLVVIESFYCGTPAITSDIDQLKEQIDQGENGFVIDCSNVSNLTSAILEYANITQEDYEVMSKNTLKSFDEVSLQHVCESHVTIYRELIKSKNG